MMITKIEVFHADAGWRPWTFVKISTDGGLTGWSECTDSHGSPHGIEGVVKDLGPLLVGQNPCDTEKLYWLMYSRTRQSAGSIIQKAIGGIENALLDIKAKSFDVPVYDLFGGKVRERLPLYWSHCGTSRVRAWDIVKKERIKSEDDVKKFGKEILKSGFRAIKINPGFLDGENSFVYMPGFAKSAGGPELNADRDVTKKIERWVSSLRDAVGDKIDIILDLNYNFKTEGYIKIGRMLEKYNLLWLEIDTYDPEALRQIKDSVKIPVCSGENLYGARQYKQYFERHAMDIVSVDAIWNGLMGSKKIADMAEIYEMNVVPHNYNGHLSTFISAQFCAMIPNFRIMEIDVDDVPWRDELFTDKPKVEKGELILGGKPGWGCDINEKALKKHPWPK